MMIGATRRAVFNGVPGESAHSLQASLPIALVRPVPVPFALILVGVILGMESVCDASEEPRWVDQYESRNFRFWGETGLLSFQRQGVYDGMPDGQWPEREPLLLPFFGVSLSAGVHFTTDWFGKGQLHDFEFRLYALLGSDFILPFDLYARASTGFNARWRVGGEDHFGVLGGGVSVEAFHHGGWRDGGPVSYSVPPNVRLLAGTGTWLARGIALELGFKTAVFFDWKKWAIGAELLLTVNRERLRITYLTQFDRGNAFGPRPFLLIAYEWTSHAF